MDHLIPNNAGEALLVSVGPVTRLAAEGIQTIRHAGRVIKSGGGLFAPSSGAFRGPMLQVGSVNPQIPRLSTLGGVEGLEGASGVTQTIRVRTGSEVVTLLEGHGATYTGDLTLTNVIPYNPRIWEAVLESRYPGEVSSSALIRSGEKYTRLAGIGHPKTSVPFDMRSFPIFDNGMAFETRIPEDIALLRDRAGIVQHKIIATRALKQGIKENPMLINKFKAQVVAQVEREGIPAIRFEREAENRMQKIIRAIEDGNERIPYYIWHHHQDFGRMQLVPRELHAHTGHAGGVKLWPQKEEI